MKITVGNSHSTNAIRVFARRSAEPTHLLLWTHKFRSIPEIPVATRGRYCGSRFNSIKSLREDAAFYGLRVVSIK